MDRQLSSKVTDPLVKRFMEADALLRGNTEAGEPEITPEAVTILFYVAACDGCFKSNMEKDLGLTVASGSRNTDLLSKHHRLKLPSGKSRPGVGLIRKERDNLDQRKTKLFLTIKGKKLIEQIKSTVYGEDYNMG